MRTFSYIFSSRSFFPSGVYNLLLNTISSRSVLAYESHRSAGSSRSEGDGGWKQVKHKVEDDVITLNWQQNIFILAGSLFFFLLQRRTSAKKFDAKNNKFIDIHVGWWYAGAYTANLCAGEKVLTRRRITRGGNMPFSRLRTLNRILKTSADNKKCFHQVFIGKCF